MKWKVTSAVTGEIPEPGVPHGREELLRVELDFDGGELSRLCPNRPAVPMGRLYLEIELDGLSPLYRQALANKSGLTTALWGSLVVRVTGARRR